jgi:4,4'-diaponeurosporenoate glycosyltransferase
MDLSGYLDVSLMILFWLLGTFLMWRIPSFKKSTTKGMPSPPTESGTNDTVSVIIPARNEAASIEQLLKTLANQTQAASEVIVVDDDSSDHTVAIAQAYGIRVIQSDALPEGWTGKNWACWQGAAQANADLLLFLDADTWLEADGIEKLVRIYEEKGGLLTVQPYHVIHDSYEELSAFFNIIQMAGLNAFTLFGEKLKPSGAFGPCLLCSREVYQISGGHEIARSEVLEGIRLSQAFQALGMAVRCYGGQGAVSFRMYPGGIRQLIEGWSKSFGKGAAAIRLPSLLMTIAWVTGCFGVTIGLARTFWLPYSLNPLPHVLLYLAFAIQIWWMLRRIGNFPWMNAVSFPVGLLFFAIIMLRSLVLVHLFGRVRWRGRTVRVARQDE